ncbi:MAG: biosynthetic-type acetolactate synthase large subunit [Planctomycetota bacterium]|jgi:acetolactate synthase-1/2/3 large subunit|nr:biosynthetic-type acetolactate synthase large subunit [Planctomycetota bacterium]
MRGANLLIQCLKDEKVEVVFGYPGGMVIPLFDAISRDGGLRFILPRHEQAGIHMADAYARVTGKPAVVFATSGPGATNLVTGIANAHLDSVPLVVFTGQVNVELIGNDAFQEVDFTGITRPISKHNYLVRDPETLPAIVREAFHIAGSGRPGPVVVDLPVNVCLSDIRTPPATEICLRGYKPTIAGNARQIDKAAKIINAAQRPLLLLGGGIVISKDAAPLVRDIVEKTKIPAVSTLMGLGVLPAAWGENLGMLGMHGTTAANLATTACDVLVAIGARFDDRATMKVAGFAPRAQIIHLDIDPTSVSKNVSVAIPIVGDAAHILRELSPRLTPQNLSAWRQQIAAWQARYPLTYARGGDAIKPQFVIEELSRQTTAGATVVTDVGQHQMWTAQYYQFNAPRSLITSGGLGTMGFGLPAGLGAQLAAPEKLTVVVTGDGGLQMNIQELATMRRLNLPVKILLLNNEYLGMVRQWQELFFAREYAFTDLADNPDFVAVAQAFGIAAWRCDRPENVASAVAQLLASPEPALLEVRIDRHENVLPMVPGGKALNEGLTAAGEWIADSENN